jgi:hypothetical protein
MQGDPILRSRLGVLADSDLCIRDELAGRNSQVAQCAPLPDEARCVVDRAVADAEPAAIRPPAVRPPAVLSERSRDACEFK